MAITYHLTGFPMSSNKKVTIEVSQETVAELVLAAVRKDFPQLVDWDGEVACDKRGAMVTFTKEDPSA